jgi:putative tryptophan/tyrosine transport system substrate-binding protein
MQRRQFITLLGGTMAAWPLVAHAQQGERVRRIAVWMGRADSTEGQRQVVAFRQRLETHGWTEGRNIQTDLRWVTGDADRIRIAKEMVEQKPDVIVAETTPAATVLSKESRTIPIVFVNVSDPVGNGLIASLAKPGGMVTGFISNEPTLGSKWPELLKEIAPQVKRVGLLFNPDTSPHAEPFLHSAEASAASFGIELKASRFRSDAEMESAIATLAAKPGGGLIVLPEPTTNVRTELIIELAARHRLPAIYAFRFQATSGGLISYGVDLAESFQSAASYVDRILRGERPADLPVQAPTKFTLVVNLKTAKTLGLTVPTSTLLRANEVIE